MKKEKILTKVFITKYALTKGIIEVEMELKDGEKWCYGRLFGYDTGFFGNDFWLNMQDAQKDAERRRLTKIERLKKQILKLEKIKF
jgi:hypothetical protein